MREGLMHHVLDCSVARKINKKRHQNYFEAMVNSAHLDSGHAGIVFSSWVMHSVDLHNFRLHLWAYSAYLDPWCAGICPVCLG